MAATAAPTLHGPRGHFIAGHLPDFRRDMLGFLTYCAREYGDIVPLRFGPRPAFLVSDPAAIEDVLVTQNRAFIKSPVYDLLRPLAGNGLFTSEGDFWRRQRRLMQPAFHRDRIAAYAELMVDYARRMADNWQDGQVRDVHQDMMGLTLSVVAKALFGAEVAEEAPEVGEALGTALEYIDRRMNSLWFFVPDVLPTPAHLRLKRAVRALDKIVYAIIEERRATGEDRGDLLSMLLHAQDEDDGTRMTNQQVRDEVMTLFLAGHETTAIALSWGWYLLSQDSEAEARLHAELDEALGDRPPGLADVPRLPYTESVVNESLRLYPPVFAIGRQPIREVEVRGHRLPKGAILLLSQWVVHRDPRWFDDPDAFKPDRWLDGASADSKAPPQSLARRLPRFAYFPFAGGPRQCIGNSFAMLEGVLLLATLAQRYRLRLASDQPVTPQPAMTLRPKNGVPMLLQRR